MHMMQLQATHALQYHAPSSQHLEQPCSAHVRRYNLTEAVGSWAYMAPEVVLGQPYNEKADCFSFSVILYEVRVPLFLEDCPLAQNILSFKFLVRSRVVVAITYSHFLYCAVVWYGMLCCAVL